MSGGYRAAQVDLADLLVVTLPPDRPITPAPYRSMKRPGGTACRLPRSSWASYTSAGVPAPAETAPDAHQPDPSKAWSWYRKGADIGEPNALARFGERDQASAVTASSPQQRDALLLKAFSSYAAAADRAEAEGWPDDTWRHWRYRRATLARLLARDGMMPQVADAYLAVRDKGRQGPPTWLEDPGDSN